MKSPGPLAPVGAGQLLVHLRGNGAITSEIAHQTAASASTSRLGGIGRATSLTAAALGAPSHLLPNVFPFLAPLKRATTAGTNLRGTIGVMGHAAQCGSRQGGLWRLARCQQAEAPKMGKSAMHQRKF